MKRPAALFLSLAIISCQEGLLVQESEDTSAAGKLAEETLPLSVTKEEALEIIRPLTDKYPDRWVEISENVIPANSSIEYAPLGVSALREEKTFVKSPGFNSWLAMVGPDVSINGGQDLLHVFIDVRTGEYTEQWLDGQAIVEWDTSRNIYIEPETEYSTLRQKTLSVKRTSTSSPDKWAVLLSGGAFKNPAFSQGRLSVMFNDPFSYVIIVSDTIQ